MQGDFEAFYLRHFKAIYRVCYAFMRNAADAEDCTEDTFVKAMSCGLDFESVPSAWRSRSRTMYPAPSSSRTVAQMLSTPSLQMRASPLVV